LATNLVARSEALARFVRHPALLGIVGDLVDPLGWECVSEPPAEVVLAPVGAGGVEVFSSLTPHLTGPNTTDEVRKAYIVQYAAAGTVVLEGDPSLGTPPAPATGRRPALPVPRVARRGGGGLTGPTDGAASASPSPDVAPSRWRSPACSWSPARRRRRL